MVSSTGFHLLLQAAEVSRDCTASNDSSSISYHRDCREQINGFVSPDNTSSDSMRTSLSLPPKKRLRLHTSLCQSHSPSPVSPLFRASSSGFLHKSSVSVDKNTFPDSFDCCSRNAGSINNTAAAPPHSTKVDVKLNANNSSVEGRTETTTYERRNSPATVSAFEDAFGNSIQMGYFSGVNTKISPEKHLLEVRKPPHRSDATVSRERKRKPRDQDIFGNAIGMGYFSRIA
mmetsp:Transcript_16434/g.34403  ORF Transcript_16434/g.34403 Transcript_16434/m.34403 type:complete len:231 (+) Transcript_16434:100-792(+)